MGKVAKTAPQNKPSDYLKYESTGRPWWTCDPKGEATLQHSETGYASYKAGIPLHTVPELFSLAVKKHPNEVALRSEDMPPLGANEKPPPALPLKEWRSWTWKQYEAESRSAAKAMISFGLQPHDACNIFGFNSPQWLIAMMGVILAGGKAAGVYPSDTAEQLQFKSDHSNGAVIVLENEECYQKVKEVASQLPMLKLVVAWAFAPQGDIKTSDGRLIKVLAWDEFLKVGAAIPDADLEGRLSKIRAGQCAALIYTSGTTGNPKAVMVSHDNIVYTAFTVLKVPNVIGNKDAEERMISYLPLSHVAGMMVDIIAPIAISSNLFGFKGWCSVNFARPYDLKKGSLVDRLGAIRPTFFLGVPRVWEKIMEKLRAVGATTKGFKKMLSTFAKSKATIYTSTRQLGGTGVTPSNLGLANVILGAIKKKLGLNKCKFMFTGAAPMTQECLEFFGALGININEVYGMSECTGAVTWSTDDYHLWGTVGFEIPGAEVRIFKKEETASNVECPPAQNVFAPSEEEQGEICYRARSIMMGYMANDRLGKAHVEEVEQKNREAIDATGFLHSGDKGTRGVNGMIKITGRYKELIIGAGGENIAPVPIEDELKRLLPFVSNVMMVGNKRKFNVAVFTLKAIGATGELPGGDKLAPPASEVSASKTITEAMKDAAFSAKIREAIITVNNNTKVVPSNAAKIQKFTILPRDFSVVTGELTATLKLKRNVVDDEFKPIIDKMYEVKDEYVPYSLAPTPNLQMGDGVAVPEEQLNLDINEEVEAAEKEFSS